MNDYIFPRAALVALVAVAGTAANVNAAITQIDHVGNFNFRVEVGGETAGLFSSVFEGRHMTVDLDESIDAWGTAEREGNPLYTGQETQTVSPLFGAEGGDPGVTGVVMTEFSRRFLDDGKGGFELSFVASLTDKGGAVYVSTARIVLYGNATQNDRRSRAMSHALLADMVFSNGGDTEWILEAGSNLRLVGLPTPATWTPLMASLVACARRRRPEA